MYIYGGRVNNDSHNDGGRSSRVVVRSVGRAEEALDLPWEQAGANRLASMVGRSDEVGLVCDCGEEVLLEARVQTWDHPHLAQVHKNHARHTRMQALHCRLMPERVSRSLSIAAITMLDPISHHRHHDCKGLCQETSASAMA